MTKTEFPGIGTNLILLQISARIVEGSSIQPKPPGCILAATNAAYRFDRLSATHWMWSLPAPRDFKSMPLITASSVAKVEESIMAKTMKAAVVREFGKPLVIEETVVPTPKASQIPVKGAAAGVCHTDLHAAEGDWPVKPKPPFIPGHEGGRPRRCGRTWRENMSRKATVETEDLDNIKDVFNAQWRHPGTCRPRFRGLAIAPDDR